MAAFKRTLIGGPAAAIGMAGSASAADLSPASWPAEIREAAEKAESEGHGRADIAGLQGKEWRDFGRRLGFGTPAGVTTRFEWVVS